MPIRILHLSDIHWCDKPDSLDTYKTIREKFLNDVKDYCEENGKVDYILICGDIAFSGKQAEYNRAERFIKKLCDATGCTKENVMVVPGNHDKDRSAHPVAMRKLIYAGLASHGHREDLMFEFLSKCNFHAPLLYEPFRHYCNFSEKYFSEEPIMKRCINSKDGEYVYDEEVDKLYWSEEVAEINGFKICIYGFNTALICDEHDYNPPIDAKQNKYQHKMILPGLAYKIPTGNPKEIRIMMCHHPLEFIEGGTSIGEELDKCFHIQFYGHVHKYEPEQRNNTLVIRSGAFQPEDGPTKEYRPTYNVVDIDCVPMDAETSALKINLDVQAWNIEKESFEEQSKKDYEIKLKHHQNRFANRDQKAMTTEEVLPVSKRQIRIELTKKDNLKAIVSHFDKSLWDNNNVRYDNELKFLKWIDNNHKWDELWKIITKK